MKEAFTEKQFILGIRNFAFQLLETGMFALYDDVGAVIPYTCNSLMNN